MCLEEGYPIGKAHAILSKIQWCLFLVSLESSPWWLPFTTTHDGDAILMTYFLFLSFSPLLGSGTWFLLFFPSEIKRAALFFFFFFCSPFIFNLLKMKNQNLFFTKSRVNSIMRYFSSSKKTQKKNIKVNFK